MKKNIELSTLFILLFTLFAMLIVFNEMRKRLPDSPSTYPKLEPYRYFGLLDTTFYDYRYHFSQSLPNQNWNVKLISKDTLKPPPYSTLKDPFEQIKWIVQLNKIDRDTLIKAKIGILNHDFQTDAQNFAITVLHTIMEKYNPQNQDIRIIQPVAGPAHRILQGYYFAVAMPEKANRVWIFTVLPRRHFFYIHFCKLKESYYPEGHEEFEKLLQQFRPLLSTFLPVEK